MRFLASRIDQDWSFKLSHLIIALLLIHKTDGTCNEDQMTGCKNAAKGHELAKLPGGGTCIAKQYVQFTHSCTVSNYVPSIDHCCCAIDQKVLCCRYHQDWDHFRCSQADDTIDTLSKSSLPLEILLPAILGPLAALVCCIVCCVKCWCYSYEEDAEVFCCCCKKCCEDRECGEEKRPPDGRRARDEVNVPLTFGHHPSRSTMGATTSQDGSETKLLQYPSENGRIEPTAPPITTDGDDSAFIRYPVNHNTHESYRRSQSVPAQAHRLHDTCTFDTCCNGSNVNGASQPPVCSSCSSCPPPSYDESQQHPVLPQQHLHQLLHQHHPHGNADRRRDRFHAADRAHSLEEAPACSVHRSDEI